MTKMFDKLYNKYPRTVIYDIEVSPCQGWFWQTGTQYIGAHNIREAGKIICISYRFMDWPKGKVKSLKWDKNQCDKKMVHKFYEEVKDAELLVGHNGDQFDKKWINVRLAAHGLPTLKFNETEDTLKQVRKQFKLPSYRLDFLCKYFKIGGKLATTSDLWEEIVFNNCKKKLKEMVEYCNNDVLILEELYRTIYPYVDHKMNLAVMHRDPSICPQCASTNIIKRGFKYLKSGIFQRYTCNECGHRYRDGKNLMQKSSDYPR